MKIDGRDEFTVDEKLMLRQNEHRQVVPVDINDKVAKQMFSGLDWLKVIHGPTRIYFRN